ncbi:MAG: SPFH domain-containing protein, partial [Pseudomonadota bacterium]
MLEVWIGIVFTAVVIIAVLYVISIWIYKRAPANMGFIRTGWMGTMVCLGRGALVLPVFHEVSWISLETMKLIVNRSRDQAVLTADKIRVDVVAEMYTHVGRSEEALLTASRSLGEKTFDADEVRNLLEAKVVGAIRSYAATKTLTELHENRDAFAKEIQSAVVESFAANGLELEEVTIVSLEQSSKEFFNANNIFDAEGLKIITEITSDAKRKVHDTEKNATLAIRQKELDTQLELLEIERKEAFANAAQDKDVANEEAQQLGEKQIFLLDRRRAVEEQEIANEVELERQRTDLELAVSEELKKREQGEIQRRLAVEAEEREKQIALIQKAREEELANIKRNLALEEAEKDRQIALIEKAKQEELADIERNLHRSQAEKARDIE